MTHSNSVSSFHQQHQPPPPQSNIYQQSSNFYQGSSRPLPPPQPQQQFSNPPPPGNYDHQQFNQNQPPPPNQNYQNSYHPQQGPFQPAAYEPPYAPAPGNYSQIQQQPDHSNQVSLIWFFVRCVEFVGFSERYADFLNSILLSFCFLSSKVSISATAKPTSPSSTATARLLRSISTAVISFRVGEREGSWVERWRAFGEREARKARRDSFCSYLILLYLSSFLNE